MRVGIATLITHLCSCKITVLPAHNKVIIGNCRITTSQPQDLTHSSQVVDNINKIVFTPRFSLMLVYDDAPHYDWVMKYQNDDVIRFLSWDHHKRMNGKNFGSFKVLLVL